VLALHFPLRLEMSMRGHQGPYTMDPCPLPNRLVNAYTLSLYDVLQELTHVLSLVCQNTPVSYARSPGVSKTVENDSPLVD
jgi:hypothetical protein